MSGQMVFQRCSVVIVLVALLSGAEAIFHVEKANVVVRLPVDIAGSYDMAIANFGSPIYGATLSCVTHARFARAKSKIERVPISDLGENLVVLTAFSCKCDTRKSDHPSLNSPQGHAGVPQR